MISYEKARSLVAEAGFNLRSWTSNNQSLRKIVDSEKVLDEDPKTKVLGLQWDTTTDKLIFAEPIINSTFKGITKREILSKSSRIYDPLGYLGPITVISKIILQNLWKLRIEWDSSGRNKYF